MKKFKKTVRDKTKLSKTQVGQLYSQSNKVLGNMKMDFKSIKFKEMPIYFWLLTGLCIALVIWFLIAEL